MGVMGKLGNLAEYHIAPAVFVERLPVQRNPFIRRTVSSARTGNRRGGCVGGVLSGKRSHLWWHPSGAWPFWHADKLPDQRCLAGRSRRATGKRPRPTDSNRPAELLS